MGTKSLKNSLAAVLYKWAYKLDPQLRFNNTTVEYLHPFTVRLGARKTTLNIGSYCAFNAGKIMVYSELWQQIQPYIDYTTSSVMGGDGTLHEVKIEIVKYK
ncbi:MAG: hypothetical protein E7110_01785 [Bacteroidales bacterium]|nr:hypothetical protein [Bacteroidales bacterium]